MALIVESPTHVIVCVHRDVIVVARNNNSVHKLTIPLNTKENRENNGKNDDTNNVDDADDSDDGDAIRSNTQTSSSNQIHLACLSQCGTMLAVTTFGDKLLHILRVNGDNGAPEIIGQREVFRVASAIRFSSDAKFILLADKTGGCYQIDLKAADGPNKWLLGHLSIVLDILMTPDQK